MDDKLTIIISIKELFEQLIDRKEFINKLSKKFNLKKESIRNHWFSADNAIPFQYRLEVLTLLTIELERQVESQNRILGKIRKEWIIKKF